METGVHSPLQRRVSGRFRRVAGLSHDSRFGVPKRAPFRSENASPQTIDSSAGSEPRPQSPFGTLPTAPLLSIRMAHPAPPLARTPNLATAPSSALLKPTPGCGVGSGRATIRSNPSQHWTKSPILCRALFLFVGIGPTPTGGPRRGRCAAAMPLYTVAG